jgi:hypothetical protein
MAHPRGCAIRILLKRNVLVNCAGDDQRGHQAGRDSGHDVVAIDAAPLITLTWWRKMVLAIVNPVATIPVIGSQARTLVPVCVAHILIIIMLLARTTVVVIGMLSRTLVAMTIVMMVIAMILGRRAYAESCGEHRCCNCIENSVHNKLLTRNRIARSRQI